MKKLDSESLFNIFSQGDEAVYQEHGVSQILDNSFVLFGMVVKGVENYYIIDQLYQVKYKEQYDSVRESIKLKYFLGLIGYLERIDQLRLDTLSIIEDEFGLQAINYALDEMITFFEHIEYYEQCCILKKYFDVFFAKKLLS